MGRLIFIHQAQLLKFNEITLKNLSQNNLTTLDGSNARWIDIYGHNTQLSMNSINIDSIDLRRSPAISLLGTYSSITMTSLNFDQIKVDEDNSIILFQKIYALQIDGIAFSNIKNHALNSRNNYMIRIIETGNRIIDYVYGTFSIFSHLLV